jgi:predicted metal-binding protein
MKHKNCGGLILFDGDCYRCQKCKHGWKCVGYEAYLKEVVDVGNN